MARIIHEVLSNERPHHRARLARHLESAEPVVQPTCCDLCGWAQPRHIGASARARGRGLSHPAPHFAGRVPTVKCYRTMSAAMPSVEVDETEITRSGVSWGVVREKRCRPVSPYVRRRFRGSPTYRSVVSPSFGTVVVRPHENVPLGGSRYLIVDVAQERMREDRKHHSGQGHRPPQGGRTARL